VFDRVRENVPRMPRAAFSQIVNRSMSEVLTRSLATTSCTLMPIIALLLFGGATLKDFAFALLIGVASGAYSSIFIASPVLTHWKERESQYRARRRRIEEEFGHVPAYADRTADVEPARRQPRRAGRLTTPEPETVSAAEFEQMKRELGVEEELPGRQTSTLTKRLAHRAEPETEAPARPARTARRAPRPDAGAKRAPAGDGTKRAPAGDSAKRAPAGDGARTPEGDGQRTPADGAEHVPAPDIPENEGVAPTPKAKRPAKSRSRNRRHGRRR
jgi:SecD/SecF fusion protein